MLVMVLVFGMMIVGCKNDDDSKGGGGIKITITGITGGGEVLMVGIMSGSGEEAAMGFAEISGGSATVALFKEDESPWNGSGSFIVYIMIDDDSNAFVYTDGKTLSELGVTNIEDESSISKLPKVTISGDVSIAFNKFKAVPTN